MSCSRPAQAYRATNSAAASPVSPSRAASFTPYASAHTETASACLRRLSPPVHSCNTCNARCRECSAIIRIPPSLPDYISPPLATENGELTTCLFTLQIPLWHYYLFLWEFLAITDRKSTRLNSSHLGISYAV